MKLMNSPQAQFHYPFKIDFDFYYPYLSQSITPTFLIPLPLQYSPVGPD